MNKTATHSPSERHGVSIKTCIHSHQRLRCGRTQLTCLSGRYFEAIDREKEGEDQRAKAFGGYQICYNLISNTRQQCRHRRIVARLDKQECLKPNDTNVAERISSKKIVTAVKMSSHDTKMATTCMQQCFAYNSCTQRLSTRRLYACRESFRRRLAILGQKRRR
jgi:hypothetical protein